MGKTKHDAKYDRRDILKPTNILKPEKASKPAKHVASTSKIFKNAKHHQSHKSKYDEGILKTRKPLQEKRLPSKYKYKLVSEHYLAAKLNESIEDSRDNIQIDSSQNVKATTTALSTRLHQIQADLSQQQEAEDETAEAFFKPLGDEQLSFSRKDGSQAGSTSLAKRIKEFKKTIAAEEKELESLFQQLIDVDQKIAAEAEAALGSGWVTLVRDFEASGGRARGGQTELAEDLEKTTSYFEDLIDKAGEKALDEVKASERAFKLRQDNDRRKIMTLASMGDDYD